MAGRGGLGVVNEEPGPGDSLDTIDIGVNGGRRLGGSEHGGCWVRTSSGGLGISGESDSSWQSGSRSNAPSPMRIRRGGSPVSPGVSGGAKSDVGSSPGLSSMKWDYAELTALKQRFMLLDEEGKGWLSRAQFFELFSGILDLGEEDAEHAGLFHFAYSLFYNSDERLNLKEFVAGMTILSKGSEEERLRYLFMMYDTEQTGYLNADQIKRVFRIMSSFARSQDFKASASMEGQSLASLRRSDAQNLSDLAVRALVEHDMDGDGRIGFDEFSVWCAKDPVVKTWMDMLAQGAARGVAKLRSEREKDLLAKELDQLGFADKAFWRESFALDPTSQAASSSILPAAIARDEEPEQEPGHVSKMESPRIGSLRSSPRLGTRRSPGRSPRRSSGRGHARSMTMNAIGTFEIDFKTLSFERQIGSGSFATVWSAKWLDSPVAVKVFRIGPRLMLNADGTVKTGTEKENEEACKDEKYRVDDESFEPAFDSMLDGGEQQASGTSTEDDDGKGLEMANHRVRFLQEVSLLKSIRHPNLLLYMGACVDARYPLCIVSELINGGSLFDCLHGKNKVRLNLGQKVMLVQNIARGMLYLHGRDPIVLHRDLKSANILISRQNDGNFKATIIDFGLSKLNTTQASLVPGAGRGLTGSLITMAPEVMNEQKYQTGSDVYSFGIVCWEIFSGRIPFGNTTQIAQLVMKVAVRGERPDFRREDDVPIAVQHLIRECWDQDVEKRPDFLAIAKTLNRIKADLGIGGE